MPISDQVKSLTADIEASYEPRRAAISDIAKEIHETLGNFKQEHEKMARDLKQFLAFSEEERRKEFATLIEKIKGEIAVLEKDTAKMLAEFRSDHQQARTHWENLTKVMATKRAGKRAHKGTSQR